MQEDSNWQPQIIDLYSRLTGLGSNYIQLGSLLKKLQPHNM